MWVIKLNEDGENGLKMTFLAAFKLSFLEESFSMS